MAIPTPTIEEVEGNSEPETVSVPEPELVEVLTEATIETIPENMQFTNYAEATQYIQNQVKSQGQKYYCTNEYKDIFPRLKQMAQEAKAKTKNHTVDMVSQAMSEAKVTWGDKVEWHNVGMLMSVTIVSGKIVNRKGIPFVQLDTPMNGKKSCKWHKGFMKVS